MRTIPLLLSLVILLAHASPGDDEYLGDYSANAASYSACSRDCADRWCCTNGTVTLSEDRTTNVYTLLVPYTDATASRCEAGVVPARYSYDLSFKGEVEGGKLSFAGEAYKGESISLIVDPSTGRAVFNANGCSQTLEKVESGSSGSGASCLVPLAVASLAAIVLPLL